MEDIHAYLLALPLKKARSLPTDIDDLEEWLAFFEINPSPDRLELSTNWHVLHYLLTGTAWKINSPFGQAVLGGKAFGAELELGAARLLIPNEIPPIAQALSRINHQDLDFRFNLEDMKEKDIYLPEAYWNKEISDLKNGIFPYFDKLQEHYKSAAKSKKAMLLYLM